MSDGPRRNESGLDAAPAPEAGPDLNPDLKPRPDAPRGRRVWPWVLGVLAALLLVLAFLPALLGGALLSRFGGDVISADRVGGPLWAPTLGGAQVTLPGVSASAGSVGVSVDAVNPFTKTVRLNVSARGADVRLKLADLLGGTGGGAGGGGGWKVALSGLDVQESRVTVDGRGINVPDGQFRVTQGDGGRVLVRGATGEGELNADLRVSESGGANVFTVDLDADARVLNHYWPGVTGGRISGQYVIGSGPIRGDLKVTDASLRVPEANFVTVTGVAGTATHRGDLIDLQLAGRGWNGPVTASGGVDLKAQNWRVTANAAPTVAGLAGALGTTGSGGLKLQVTAGGWSTVRVTATAQGAGEVAGVGFRDAAAKYAFLSENGNVATQTNDLSFSAVTSLAGSDQKLAGRWAFGKSGVASLVGAFGQKPLNVNAGIDAKNVLTLRGEGLGGPLSGTLNLSGVKLNAVLNPTYGAVQARVAVRGTPDDLRATISGAQAGPFSGLSGTAALDRQGLRADLGAARIDLNREFRGTWQAQGLSGAGIILSGRGRLDLTGGDVTGQLEATVPGVRDTLAGPLDLNYTRQRGTFRSGAQVLTWNGDSFGVQARNLDVSGGLDVSGDVTVTTALKAFGTLRATGAGVTLNATARGTSASLRGSAGGVTVLADTQLQAPYLTTARVQGADIQGVLSVNRGVRFTLTTAGDTARGVIDGDRWDATGRVNLAALRPLVNVDGLGGTLDLNLAAQGGSARVNARALGAGVTGTLTRTGGPLGANLRVTYAGAQAALSGRVYPDVQAQGRVSAQGQTLNLGVTGGYGDLRARVTGQTGPLSFSGVTLPAQPVNLSGTLTPRLTANGTWGDLNVTYDAATGLARVTGQQALTAFGQAGRVQGRATWGPGPGGSFRGAVAASGVLDQYTVALNGPWDDLNVLLSDGEGLRARGTASLPAGRYDVNVSGPLGGGLFVDGNVQGTGLEPRGNVTVTDAQGGRAQVTLRGFENLSVQAQGLTLGGQSLRGNLSAVNGVLNGTLKAGPLDVRAVNGQLRVSGELAGQTVLATGKVTLPATLENLNLSVTGPYFAAQAGGNVANLRGTLTLKAQSYGSGAATLSVPAQSFPLSGSLTGARVSVGGLTYRGGMWSGALGARYALSGQPGTLRVLGEATRLTVAPTGPVAGRVTVLPELGGAVSADLTAVRALLPATVRPEVVAGRLVASLSPTSAVLSTAGTRYLGDPLGLNARVDWAGGLRASGTLTHPGTRIPVRFDGRALTVSGAALDARVLTPVLAGAAGRVTLNLTLPDLTGPDPLARASGRADVNVRAGTPGNEQSAQGRVTLARGQLSANLSSSLAGYAVTLRGPLYPQANAALTLDDLRATLTGRADTTLTLRATGAFQGRVVNLTATGTNLTGTDLARRAAVTLSGTLAGAAVNLNARQAAGGASLSDWQTAGSVSVADLRPLAGVDGTLNAMVGGTLGDLRVQASGAAAGVRFTAPARYVGGVLRVDGAQATLMQGSGTQATVSASGTVLPALKLSARATLNEWLPGTFTAQIGGALARPDVSVQGVLTDGQSGLRAAGSRVRAHLLGRNYRADFTGAALSGGLRGQLGANALGGLLNAALQLNTTFVSGPNVVRLSGPIGWRSGAGFSGNLRAVGDIPGGPLDALLDGTDGGALKIAALIGTGARQARVTGQLPADLPFRPGGTLNLQAFDAGALWGRAAQLTVSGQATLGGATWTALNANFAGRVLDSAGDFTGDLGATYRAGNASLRLSGERISGGGTLEGGEYRLTLRAGSVQAPLRVARLLPAGLGVDALTAAGTLNATGSLSGGLREVTARTLAVKGVQAQSGPFSLYGQAAYVPRTGTLSADLNGSLRGGLLRASGSLPAGLRVTAQGVDSSYLNAASLGQGKLAADVTLRGAVTDPLAQGTLDLKTDALNGHVILSGRVVSPDLNARVDLLGSTGGTLYAQASDLDLARGRVNARVYGTVTSGGSRAALDMRGSWPNLTGTVQAQVAGLNDPVTLSGNGRGSYDLNAGTLGGGTLTLGGGSGSGSGGLIPALGGTLNLTPLPLLGGTGQLTLAGTLGGTLAAPTLAAAVQSAGASAYDVTLEDLSGTLNASLAGLSGTLSQVVPLTVTGAVPTDPAVGSGTSPTGTAQGTRAVLTLNGTNLTLDGLRVRAAGSTMQLGGTASLSGPAADLKVASQGTLDGTLKATYRAQALAVSGALSGPQSLRAALDVQADPLTGWHGTARVTGGPAGVLTAPLALTVGGAFAHPLVTGSGELLKAGARVVASADGVQLRLVDAPGAKASGAVELRPRSGVWTLLGAASLTRPELSLSVTPSGPLSDPDLLLSVRRGGWRAGGTASLDAADLTVSDGLRDGTLRWTGGQLAVNLPGLTLDTLNLKGVSGLLSASGTVGTDALNGQLTASLSNLSTPYRVPYLDLALGGDLNAVVTLRGGRPSVTGTAALPAGTLNFTAAQASTQSSAQAGGQWTGRVSGTVSAPLITKVTQTTPVQTTVSATTTGTLGVDVRADGSGLTGQVTATRYPLTLAGQTLNVSGTLGLTGQAFRADLRGSNDMGEAVVAASGGLADLLPALSGPLAVQPTGDGYTVRATLDNVEVQNLKIAPQLSGRVSGEANLRDGGGTFVLRSDNLTVGPKVLPARLEGTQVSGDWRIRGFLGQSEFTAGLGSGELFGQGTLRALPLGAVIGAFAGTSPGEGVVTGLVRFRFPVSDPLAGTASVVAERIRVSSVRGTGTAAVTETLTGTGTLEYARRELRNLNIQLSGAGTWDVRGQYTRERVAVTAQFSNTTFTPALLLVPALAALQPDLKGTLELSAAGTYERPRGLIRAQNITGSVAGLSVSVPAFAGDLPDSGAFTGGGTVLTGGTVGSNGQVTLAGQLTLGRLSDTRVNFSGLLAPQVLGSLPNTTVTLAQQTESRWTLNAQSLSAASGTVPAGSLSVTGDLAPRWDLTLAARNFNLPLKVIYGRESTLNADLRAVDDGEAIRISGAADFTRLILGRSNAQATLPAPGQTSVGSTDNTNGRTTDNYVSPLPEELRTFPQAAQPEGTRPARPFLERLSLEDIPIRAVNGIRVDENLVRADFTGSLVVSGTGARPRLTGDIRSQRGFVYLRENEFTLADSTVTFGGENLYPKFNVTATGQVTATLSESRQRVPVKLNLQGEFVTPPGGAALLDLTTTLSCAQDGPACADPTSGAAYSEAELYALVATGVPNLTALPSNLTALGTSAFQTALNVFVLGELERTIAAAFGLDVFRLTPQLGNADGSLGATITLGSYLTRDLYLQYQVDLNGEGLIDAQYSTPDDQFTFRVSTPISGLNLQSIRPSFSAGYNVNGRTNVSLGVESAEQGTTLRFGVTYRIGGR
ncbi:translocation/assembly module TamB domain-containing protein [Deinococcus sp. A31D244]|uniref:translocation/assembly module TamB domain-containing protein n=1 Tax=Deinococcus sp. A31D244 TaxID=3397675 RepID=UPI0039E17C72